MITFSLQMNERILSEPNLLYEDPSFKGYLAIFVVTDTQKAFLKSQMMTPPQYLLHCQSRPSREDREREAQEIALAKEKQKNEAFQRREAERLIELKGTSTNVSMTSNETLAPSEEPTMNNS